VRLICGFLLLLVVGAAIPFAVQNGEGVNVNYASWSGSLSLPLLVGAAYALGMATGGAVVGALRYTLHRATEEQQPRH
jgi:uncharacterized integral membrane protein